MTTLITNSNLFSALLIAIILIAFLFVIFIVYTLRMRNKEKGIYENELDNNLVKKALDEIELREKIKKITKQKETYKDY